MATINPPALYTGGAVTVNSQPIASMYHQQVMKKQMRDDALDDYFRNQFKNINPAGMRQQDINGLMQKTNEWNQFYQQNKDRIKNPKLDNGKALTEYQGRYQDQLAYIEQSKNRAATKQELGKARLNPNTSFIFDDDEILGQIEKDDLPLNDPNHKPIDIYQLNVQAKPIDVKEWQALQKSSTAGLKPSEIVDKIEVDPKTLDTITTVRKSYSPEDMQAIGNRYKSMYQLDRRVRATADKNLLNAPNASELNDVYKSVYGKNAETPADLLAAQGILNAQSEGIVQKRTPGSLEQKKMLEGMKQANRQQMAFLRSKIKKEEKELDNIWVSEFVGKIDEEADQTAPIEYKTASGQTTQEKQIPMDATLAKALTVGKFVPDYLRKTADGKYRPVFFKRDDKGNKIGSDGRYAVDADLSQPISRSQLVLAIAGTRQSATQRAQEMQNQNAPGGTPSTKKTTSTKTYIFGGKSYTHKQLNEMGYDDSEIEQAKKAGLIK